MAGGTMTINHADTKLEPGSDTKLEPGADIKVIGLHFAIAADVDLSDAKGQGTNAIGAVLTRGKFARADLRGALLCHCDLTGADFTDADLTGANLHGSNVIGATFAGALLDGVVWDACKGAPK